MFAVGSNSVMTPYSFYEYTTASGFMDTSTILTVVQSSILNTIQARNIPIISTIPFTKWVSTDTTGAVVLTTTYPFYYDSVFQNTISTIPSSIQVSYTSTLLSTIYPRPVSLYPSSIPIYPNSFLSSYTTSFLSTIPYFISTSASFGPIVSTGVLAASYPFDFISSYSGTSATYPLCIQSSNLWLDPTLSQYINSGSYNVQITFQYSLWLSSPTSSYSWVNTTGYFGMGQGLTGQTCTTRVGDRTYSQITNTFLYTPEPNGQQTLIGANTSNFTISVCISTINTLNTTAPSFDIYIPGTNNFTITLIPI
jgi:hypothetical protein